MTHTTCNTIESIENTCYYSEKCDSLPVLDLVTHYALKLGPILCKIDQVAFVYVHHPLKSSVNVLKALITLGADPGNIFVLGKKYSESLRVVETIKKMGVNCEPCSPQNRIGEFREHFTHDISSLWRQVENNVRKGTKAIVVADHGGYALSCIPKYLLQNYQLIGLEKTTGGFINFNKYGLPPIPVVNVANSAAKKHLESPLIASSIVNKLAGILPVGNYSIVCGVVGYGAVGQAVVKKLLSIGFAVIIYDSDLKANSLEHNTLYEELKVEELSTIFKKSTYIFGCTGRDITGSLDLINTAEQNITLISCSSGDQEFFSLLKSIQKRYDESHRLENPFEDIKFRIRQGVVIHIVKGGFPVNFDSSGESVPPNDIQLTRALVLAGILQCVFCISSLKLPAVYSLDSALQKLIATEWLKYQPEGRFPASICNSFDDLEWIEKNSPGKTINTYSLLNTTL